MLHDIIMLFTKYLHILHHLQAMKNIYSQLFLICTCKDPNLAENFTNLAENQKNSLTPWSLWSTFIPSLVVEGIDFEGVD